MAESGSQESKKAPSFNGINHLKLPCFSIKATLDFYTQILPFQHIPMYDHFTPDHRVFAQMMRHNELIVELRYSPAQAEAQKGWDPITWGVNTRQDLEEWSHKLDTMQVKRSKIFMGIKGWVMGFEDPDGRIVRLYVEKEEHEWTDHPDQDDFWLGKIEADPQLQT